MSFFRKHAYALIFSVALTMVTSFVLLDTFVLPHAVTTVSVVSAAQEATDTQAATTPIVSDTTETETTESGTTESVSTETSSSSEAASTSAVTTTTSAAATSATTSSEPVITDNSYSGNGVNIVITTERVADTDVYVADVQLSSAESLKTALAQNTFGSNITQTTSAMAAVNNAILAINGDYYGANKRGYVIKNGILYRDTVRQGTDTQDLVIYADGTFAIIDETEVSAQELIDSGVVQLLSFGPALIDNGTIQVSSSDEVGKAQSSNPRTAIGMIDDLHYIIVVADGRTSASAGLSLLELADLMQSYGCVTAYNLDGGGSSTMVFNGTVVNNPTANGKNITERSVSDIVYIGV